MAHDRDKYKTWVLDIIGQNPDVKITAKKATEMDLVKEFHKKFGIKKDAKNIASLFYYHYRQMNGSTRRKPKSVHDMAQTSGYLLFLYDGRVIGYETLEEVRKALEDNMIISGFSLFKKANVKVDYKVVIE